MQINIPPTWWYVFKHWLAWLFSEKHTCSDRQAQCTRCQRHKENPDHWRKEKDGTKTCSFCGSIRFEDLMRFVDAAMADPSKVMIEVASGKNYKIYCGGRKFYTWHFPKKGTAGLDESEKARLNEALKKCHEHFYASIKH